MSWTTEIKHVRVAIGAIVLFLILGWVFDLGYHRTQLEQHDARLYYLEQRAVPEHGHVYHDQSVRMPGSSAE